MCLTYVLLINFLCVAAVVAESSTTASAVFSRKESRASSDYDDRHHYPSSTTATASSHAATAASVPVEVEADDDSSLLSMASQVLHSLNKESARIKEMFHHQQMQNNNNNINISSSSSTAAAAALTQLPLLATAADYRSYFSVPSKPAAASDFSIDFDLLLHLQLSENSSATQLPPLLRPLLLQQQQHQQQQHDDHEQHDNHDSSFAAAVKEFQSFALASSIDIHTAAQTADRFSCSSLPSKYDPTQLCSGVVDYEFILYENVTAAGLNSFGKSWMNTFTRYLGPDCLTDVKRLVCAVLYKPCVPNVVAGDIATYQSSEFGIALPFLRPCGDICLNTTSSGTTCGGLLEAFGLAPNCGGYTLTKNTAPARYHLTYDYFSTPVSLASTSTAGPFCNDLASTAGKQLVHDQKEKYVGEYCAGVKETWWHAQSDDFDASLAPFLPPFVLQKLIDAYLQERFESPLTQLLPFRSEECFLARRIYLCTSFFLEAYPSDALAAYFGTIYVPSFPHRANCRKFVTTCNRERDCAVEIITGTGDATKVHLFSKHSQVVETLDVGTGTPLLISTPPYKLDTQEITEVEYSPSCPQKFQYNEDADPKNSLVYSGSDCALECPGATTTDDEYSILYQQRRIANWFSVGMGLLQMLNLSLIKSSRQNIFVLGSVFAVLVYNFMQAVLLELHASEPKGLLCADDITWRDADIFGEDIGTSMCTVAAIVGLYQRYFTMGVMLTLAIDLWLRIVMGKKDRYINYWRWFYMSFTAASMITCSLLEHFYYHNGNITSLGNARVSCDWGRSDRDQHFYLNQVPMIITVGISFLLFAHSCYVVVKTSLRVSDVDRKPFRKLWRNYSMIFLFVMFHLVLYPFTITIRSYLNFVKKDDFQDSYDEWWDCMFEYFRSADDKRYLDECGLHPDERQGLAVEIIDVPVLYVTACILFYITLYKEVRVAWTNFFRRILIALGIKFAAQKMLPKNQRKILSLVGQLPSSAGALNSASLSGQMSDDSNEEEQEGIKNKRGIKGTLRMLLTGNGVNPLRTGGWNGANAAVNPTQKRSRSYIPRFGGSSRVVVPELSSHAEEGEETIVRKNTDATVVDSSVSRQATHSSHSSEKYQEGLQSQETDRATIDEEFHSASTPQQKPQPLQQQQRSPRFNGFASIDSAQAIREQEREYLRAAASCKEELDVPSTIYSESHAAELVNVDTEETGNEADAEEGEEEDDYTDEGRGANPHNNTVSQVELV